MKTYTVIVELEVHVIAKNPKAVDNILAEAQFVARRTPKTNGGLHVERVLKYSQYHHEH